MATTEQAAFFRVNGRDYAMPTDLTLGEMCDAERFFGVEFGESATTGVRMAAALLWIAISREDKTVTVEDIRALPLDVFANISALGDDAGPPPSELEESTDSSGDASEPSGDGRAAFRAHTGAPS